MKKNIVAPVLIIFLTGLLIAGCSKSFLQVNPQSQVVESNFYQNETEAAQALAGVYDVLTWSVGGGFHPVHCWSEAASDDAYSAGDGPFDGYGMKCIENFDKSDMPGQGTYEGLWSNYYTGIARANTYLSKIAGVAASDAYKKETIAEAKFLRAHYYFELDRWFENVPLVTAPLTDPAKYNQPQATPQAVFNQIAQDLLDAMADLPKENMQQSLGRPTYWSAVGLLARAYLFFNSVYNQDLQAGSTVIDKAAVRAYLDDLISNSGLGLMPEFADIFSAGHEFNNESVWELSYSSLSNLADYQYDDVNSGEGNLNVFFFAPYLNNPSLGNYLGGWSYATITQSLYNEFETGDLRRDQTIMYDSEYVAGVTPYYQYTGYYNKKYNSNTANGPSILNFGTNYREIRFADVLLMASELWLTDDAAKATDYLNRVRDRAHMPAVTATTESIRHERRVELAGEGIRFWDLLRYGLDYTKQKIDASSLMGPRYDGDPSTYQMDWNTARRGRLPIPSPEIDISNGTLIQNTGY